MKGVKFKILELLATIQFIFCFITGAKIIQPIKIQNCV